MDLCNYVIKVPRNTPKRQAEQFSCSRSGSRVLHIDKRIYRLICIYTYMKSRWMFTYAHIPIYAGYVGQPRFFMEPTIHECERIGGIIHPGEHSPWWITSPMRRETPSRIRTREGVLFTTLDIRGSVNPLRQQILSALWKYPVTSLLRWNCGRWCWGHGGRSRYRWCSPALRN